MIVKVVVRRTRSCCEGGCEKDKDVEKDKVVERMTRAGE